MQRIQKSILAGAALASMAPALTCAQEVGEGGDGRYAQVEEVVVTAQKRSQNLQEVPISISAFSGETLEAAGVGGTKDLTTLVPGLVFNQSFSAGNSYIRGVGQSTGLIGTESPNAIYLDGVYLAQSASGVFSLTNVERVEVLKGPQGTLFGRNSTGGLIHVITKIPNQDRVFNMDVGYGNFETYTAHLYASGGLAENLAGSLAVYGQNQAQGYGFNIQTNEEIFKTNQSGVQGKLVWTLNPETTVGLNVVHSYNKSEIGTAYGIPPGSLAQDGVTRYKGLHIVELGVNPFNRQQKDLASLRIDHDLGFARLMSLTAYHEINDRMVFLQNGVPFGRNQATVARYANGAYTWTQELQVQAPPEEDFQWIAGLYYLFDKVHVNQTVFRDTAVVNSQLVHQTTESIAGFVQGTKSIFEHTRLTAGARYTRDEKSVDGVQWDARGVITSTFSGVAEVNKFPTSKAWGELTYRVAVDHDFAEDVLGYISFNRGFKSGVYGLSQFTNPPADPETVNAYEAGLKTQWFDRRLKLNVAAYYYDYKNIQVRTIRPPVTFIVTYNAAESEVKGVDVDFEAVPAQGLSISGGFSVLDASYSDFTRAFCAVANPAGGNASTVQCDLTGTRMARSPTFTGNIGIRYEWAVSADHELEISVNDYYNSGFLWDPGGALHQEPYHSLSAALTWRRTSTPWEVQLWGKNLGDEAIWSTATASTSDTYGPGAPRTFGVTLAYRP